MIIDILLLIFAIAGFWWGYTRGILGTLAMVCAYIGVILVTLKISPWLMDFLTNNFQIGKVFALIFGTIAIIVLLVFLVHFLAKRIANSFKKGKLSGSEKILGGIVMLCMGIIFYSMILWPLNQFRMVGEKAKQSSISYPTLEAMPVKARSVVEEFKPLFSRYWQLMEETIQEAQSTSK